MRRLFPDPLDALDAGAAYGVGRPAPPGRPWVLVDMVASIDGATAIDGRSGALGGAGDRDVFHALRSLADIILVGAATVRAERYGPVRLSDEIAEQRVLRGQAALPRLAVVTRSLDLDLSSELFATDPIVVTCPGSSVARRVEVAAVADIMLAGTGDQVALDVALATLGELGARLVVCEGGPRLNAQLAAADLIDEVCLTVAPLLAGGDSSRVLRGLVDAPRRFELAHVLSQDDELFLRYVRRGP